MQDFVLLKVVPAGETKGGIVMAGEEGDQYVVVAKGPGRMNEEGKILPIDVPLGVSVGLIGTRFSSAEPMVLNGKRYVLARARDISGVFDEIV